MAKIRMESVNSILSSFTTVDIDVQVMICVVLFFDEDNSDNRNSSTLLFENYNIAHCMHCVVYQLPVLLYLYATAFT